MQPQKLEEDFDTENVNEEEQGLTKSVNRSLRSSACNSRRNSFDETPEQDFEPTNINNQQVPVSLYNSPGPFMKISQQLSPVRVADK